MRKPAAAITAARSFNPQKHIWLAAAVLVASNVNAQDWPARNQPIRIVVGFSAGGGTDQMARIIANDFAAALNGNVIVENRPGAGGLPATEYVAKAKPDGYTLYMATPSSFTVWPNLRKLNYNVDTDFAPVAQLAQMPVLVAVNAASPFHSVADLLKAARSGSIDYASGGVGTLQNIAGEYFNKLGHVKLKHIPYKGTAPAITDLIAGTVPVAFVDPAVSPHVASGRLRLLAVTTGKRSRLYPETPTLDEAGVPGYDLFNWYGLVAPRDTPKDVVEKMNAALAVVMAKPDIRKKMEDAGMEPAFSTPAHLGQLISSEKKKWGEIIKSAGIKGE